MKLREEAIVTPARLRTQFADLAAKVQAIRNNRYWSDEGKTAEIGKLIADGRAILSRGYESEMLMLDVERERRVKALGKLTEVSDADLQRAALTLAPVINNAVANPDGLIAAYRRTYADKAARQLLEAAALSTADALSELGEGQFFVEKFLAAKQQLLPTRDPGEIAGDASIAEVDEARAYMGHAFRVLDHSVREAEAGQKLFETSIPISQAEVNRYENGLPPFQGAAVFTNWPSDGAGEAAA